MGKGARQGRRALRVVLTAMVGSANFSYDALSVNHELDVVLDRGAAATVGAFAAQVARADA